MFRSFDRLLKVGDQVLFTSYAGDEFKIEGDQKGLLMREDDILGVIETLEAAQ